MRSIKRVLRGTIPIIIILVTMSLSLKIHPGEWLRLKLDSSVLIRDLSFSLLRVTCYTISGWLLAIICGFLCKRWKKLQSISYPAVNFLRNISPFAWLPFAIIWFGLGEAPIAFVMLITIFLPALLAVTGFLNQTPGEYLDEAAVAGASFWQTAVKIELPLNLINFLNLFRMLWGLAWATIIAAEMLGVRNGLGFRLLDLRYLLKYSEMLIYLGIMGIIGVCTDKLLEAVIMSEAEKING